MTDYPGIERHFTKIAAIGRCFQLGDLYDYRSDNILTECRLWWESSKLAEATRVKNEFKLNLIRPDSKFNSKWQHMGLDDHLQASIVTGVKNYVEPCIFQPILNFMPQPYYVNDQPSPLQATQTLVCRAKSRKERLDSSILLQNNPLRLPESTDAGVDWPLPKATHVVVGIVYGAEAYCVLTQDLGSHKLDEDAREEAQENLGKFANKLENALGDIDFDSKDLPDFKSQFNKDEKAQLTRLNCRLYVDLQHSSAVRECNIVDVYAHCLKMTRQIKSDVENKCKAIPITVLLCPVNTILELTNGRSLKAFEFRDVDSELTARLCHNWVQLERIETKVNAAIRTTAKKVSRPSLRLFLEILTKYKDLLRESLKNGVIKAREEYDGDDYEVDRVTSIAENHGLFKPSRLERWLEFKVSESKTVTKISNINGIVFVSGKKQLEIQLADSLNKKHALVLNIPSLDEKANGILDIMKDYCENYTKLVAVEDNEEDNVDEDGLPWHMVPRKTKQVMDKIREFIQNVENNDQLKNHIQFIITPGEPGKEDCHYSVYEADNLLKDNISQLPVPPTGLKIQLAPSKSTKKLTPSIIVVWVYDDLGYPCHFSVEFRPKNSSDSWTQQKTTKSGETQMILNFNSGGPELEIRVAADTCIGRSEFSDVVDTESELGVIQISDSDEELECRIRDVCLDDSRREASQTEQSSQRTNKKSLLQPPTGLQCDLVTQSTAELSWSNPVGAGNSILTYRVHYWRDGQSSSSAHELDVSDTGCRLQELRPTTTYFVNVVAISRGGQEVSAHSQTVQFTTQVQEVRLAETIVRRCEKIGNRNGMDLFAVPLTKSYESRTTADRFAFGRPVPLNNGRLQHRTVLVMGASGSGKTTLINGMINYIFNVKWEDTFRFQLIQEKQTGLSQVDCQTSRITAYDIHHVEGFRIPYSLTIVDTPGYGDTKGLERDHEITEMVRKFFEDKNGIQELDMVGFVTQAFFPRLSSTQIYIFDSVLSIFGNDIKENINFLLTFADSQVPPVLSAISEANLPYPTDPDTGEPLHHKFNNSGFFCSSHESAGNTVDKFNRFFWRMGMENFQKFFSVLATMKTKSLSLTKQVLEERKQLEATVDGLQPLIKIGLSKMEEMRKTKQMITNSQAQIEANDNFEFEVEVTVPQKIELPAGQYITYCNKCYITCHNSFSIPNDGNKVGCWAMDSSGNCRICPRKCKWNMHVNQPYRWEYVTEKQATSSDAIKQKYEAELKRKLTAEKLVKVLEKDVEDNNKIVHQRVDTVARCIQKLDEIALRPNPCVLTPQYIDLIIDAEQQEKRLGFKERIESLKKLRQMAVITSKIKNKESLLSLDRKDNLDDQADDADADEDDDDNDYSNQDRYSYSNAQTAFAEDDDNYDCASLVSSASTYRQKFKNSFWS